MRYLKTGFFGLIALALFATGGVLIRHQLEKPAPWDTGYFLEVARQYEVEILRDTYGVPYIYGARDADVAYGLGFAHSEDDFNTIESTALMVRGELAAHEGIDAAVTDFLSHFFGVWEGIERDYDSFDPELRRLMEAYADGVNLFAALHPEQRRSGFAPLTGKDVAAGFVFRTPFFYGLDQTLKGLFGPTRAYDVAQEPDLKQGAVKFLTDPLLNLKGSNGWAVAPHRSSDKTTRLLVNSHQPFTGPVAWYEVRLKSEEGWDAAGGTFPGAPFMLHGATRHLGWANTVNKPDLADVFVLDMHPEDDMLYRMDGEWLPLTSHDASIRVKLWGPFFWTVTREVLRSVHGPVLRTDHGTYGVRYAGMGETNQAAQYYALNKATNFEEWRAAMEMHLLPSINYIYADEEGNIAYLYNAQIPKRVAGWDWSSYLPGDRSDLIWTDYHDLSAMPFVINPASGFVFNANNTPFRATSKADNVDQASFPETMGIETRMTNRGFRAEELLSADSAISEEDFKRYKYDLAYSAQSETKKLVVQLLQTDLTSDPALVDAQAVLAQWDMNTNKENRYAALGVLTTQPFIIAQLRGEPRPDLVTSFTDAVATLTTNFGRTDPEWGEVNRMIRGSVDLPIDGAPDMLRAIYGAPGEDGRLTAVAGDTFFMFVSWDSERNQKIETVHQFGSATLDEGSPHYDDQAPLFVRKETKPIYMDKNELEKHLSARYRPGLL